MRARTVLVCALTVSTLALVPSSAGATEPGERVPVELDRSDHHDQLPKAPQAFRPEATSGWSPAGSGYWMLDVSGEVYAFGDARDLGGPRTLGPQHGFPNCHDWVIALLGYCDMAIDIEVAPPTPGLSENEGYWALSTTGRVWAFGTDTPNLGHFVPWWGDPWMSITSTADGLGLWGFSYHGCVDTLGNAPFHGDMCDVRLNAPIVGSAVTPSGGGYYMVAQDGGIFSFGDAQFHGSTGSMHLNQPVIDMVVTPTGKGYWLVARDGGIFSFGDAQFHGSMGAVRLNQPISGMVGSPTGRGYLMVAEDGGIFSFGDVPFHGSLGADPPHWPVVSVTVR